MGPCNGIPAVLDIMWQPLLSHRLCWRVQPLCEHKYNVCCLLAPLPGGGDGHWLYNIIGHISKYLQIG